MTKFEVGDFVMIKNEVRKKDKAKEFKPKFTGPFRPIEKLPKLDFRAKNRGDKKGTVIHVNRRKKFFEQKAHWETEESTQPREPIPTPRSLPKGSHDVFEPQDSNSPTRGKESVRLITGGGLKKISGIKPRLRKRR